MSTDKNTNISHVVSFNYTLFIVCRMDEVSILMVYLEDVEYHLPNEFRKGDNFAEDGVATKFLRGRHIERETDEEEQQPPFDAPLP